MDNGGNYFGKMVFCSWEFALSNSVIVLFLVSMRVNRKHYFQRYLCTFRSHRKMIGQRLCSKLNCKHKHDLLGQHTNSKRILPYSPNETIKLHDLKSYLHYTVQLEWMRMLWVGLFRDDLESLQDLFCL